MTAWIQGCFITRFPRVARSTCGGSDSLMSAFLRWLQRIFLGGETLPTLEEERFPRDAAGRPDLARFTQPVAHYSNYIEEYLASLDSRLTSQNRRHPATSAWQSYAYRKGVLGQWGLIARGPAEALPVVLRFLQHPLAEGRQAGAGVLEAWTREHGDFEAIALAAAERELGSPEPDIETLAVLFGVLARARSESALPLLARVLRAPESSVGDLDWSAVEAVETIAGQRFKQEANPKQAAESWLRERGL